jgi:hypothetical protein
MEKPVKSLIPTYWNQASELLAKGLRLIRKEAKKPLDTAGKSVR